MSTEESVLLEPIYDLILKFRKRKRILSLLTFLSLPAAVISAFLFAVLAIVNAYSIIQGVFFAFFVFSAVSTIVMALFIPDSLDTIIDRMETTAENISFTITSPKGNTSQDRILNQLLRTDRYIGEVVKRFPQAANTNVLLTGLSGRQYSYDVYIGHSSHIGGHYDLHIFSKRIDGQSPVSVEEVKTIKEGINDCMLKIKRKVPTRVLLVSTSGFDDEAFEYVRSKEGVFTKRGINFEYCIIELIKEKIDGSFDMLSF
jgi:hypothetical protein